MRTPLQQRLSGGDRKSVGDALEVAIEVLDTPSLLHEIIDGLRTDDFILRSRCAHTIASVGFEQPELLESYKAEFLNAFSLIEQWEVREQMSKVIPLLQLDSREMAQAETIMELYLADRSSIVRTCALQARFDLLKLDASKSDDVHRLLTEVQHTGSAAMRARSRILLTEMDKWPSR